MPKLTKEALDKEIAALQDELERGKQSKGAGLGALRDFTARAANRPARAVPTIPRGAA